MVGARCGSPSEEGSFRHQSNQNRNRSRRRDGKDQAADEDAHRISAERDDDQRVFNDAMGKAHVPIDLPDQAGSTVRVGPGDLVLADGDGVVFIPREFAQTVIEDAEGLARIEKKIGEELRGGDARADVFKRNPRFDHIRPAMQRDQQS